LGKKPVCCASIQNVNKNAVWHLFGQFGVEGSGLSVRISV